MNRMFLWLCLCLWLLMLTSPALALFLAVPLTDFSRNQKYLGTFPGLLYEGSNDPPSDHLAEGLAATKMIVPLNAHGLSSTSGKIVVVGIGMSNWTNELCDGNPYTDACATQSFLAQAAASPAVNHADLVLVDCARGGHAAVNWINDSFGNYSLCQDVLAAHGVTEQQVEVILYKDADEFPQIHLSRSTVCAPTSPVDACHYEYLVGLTARYAKSRYPHLRQMFLHSRIYAGYATTLLNPEPYAYEYGFATKWLIEAQIVKFQTGVISPTAGDLSYAVAPWLGWGPYFWAADDQPRSDGLVWLPSDFGRDGTHPSLSGINKAATMMMNFHLNSDLTPWFR